MADTNPGPAITSTGSLVATVSNVTESMVLGVALTPASVAADTSAEQLFTVTGVLASDFISVNKPTSQAGLGIAGVRASAANQIGITYQNSTAAAITPTSETYLVKVEHLAGGVAGTAFPY